MEEKKMPTELSEMELESVDGGAAVHNGHRITTALTSSKGCPYYDCLLYTSFEIMKYLSAYGPESGILYRKNEEIKRAVVLQPAEGMRI